MDWLWIAGASLLAFAVSVAALGLLAPLSARFGLVDRPGGRKTHARTTPVIGGLGLLGGTAVPALLLFEPSPELIGLCAAAALMIVVGLLDDLRDLPWPIRVLAQVAAAALIIAGGVRVEHIGPLFGLSDLALGSLSIPFTVLAVIGLVNAVNMIDGVDGLSGTVGLAALVMLAAAAAYSGNKSLANGLLLVSGGLLGFLVFNFRLPGGPHARVFLGNAGSALLGLLIAWASFRLTQNPGHPVTPVLAPFLIAAPVIDTLVLMIRRTLHGHSPFHADRNHIHHLLGDAGMPPWAICLLLGGFSLVSGLAAGLALRADVPQSWLLAAFSLMVIGWFALTHRRERAVRMLALLVPKPRRVQEPAPASE